MGHGPERPYVSRRDFLKRAGVAGGVALAGPMVWRRLAFAAEAPVRQVHLTFGADAAREVVVSFMTPAPVKNPFVQIAGERYAARTTQYPGYPGFFHHVELNGLEPATRLTYRIGHSGKPLTPANVHTTGPDGRAPFTFTAFGDQGVDFDAGAIPPLSQPPNQASANTELAHSFRPAMHLIVGDLAYANGDQHVWDTWFDMIEPMASHIPWMPAIGNHEIETQLAALTGGGTDSWGDWGYDPYRTRFALPANGHDRFANCFYAFRYAGVHFISIDNNDVNDEIAPNKGYTGGRQRTFVAKELEKARQDPAVDFIVVLMHQCAFSSSSKHGSDEGVRRAWGELFAKHSVDLVLQGHDHVYERTNVMKRTEVVGSEGPYDIDVGTVYVTCGNGGAVQEPFMPERPLWSAFRQDFKVGTLTVRVEPDAPNGTRRLVLGEYWALDGSPIEENIVLERKKDVRAAVASAGDGSPARRPAPVPKEPEPVVSLPATGGPGAATLVGTAAAAGGAALHLYANRERRDRPSD